jgi:hypothetical protein
MALQGLLAANPRLTGGVIEHTNGIAATAYALADAMLKAGEE